MVRGKSGLNNDKIKRDNENDDHSHETAIANNNDDIAMNNYKNTCEQNYQETDQERLSLERYEESFMKQPSIKRGIFEHGSVPHETDSDFEFVDKNIGIGKPLWSEYRNVDAWPEQNQRWNFGFPVMGLFL